MVIFMNPDLLQYIEQSMPTLSKSQRRIGRYICTHYDKAAYMTAAKLGSIAGVSESTVVRFANELGYDGYPALQAALRELIRTRLTALQRIEITNERIGDADILTTVLNSDIDKIRYTLETIDRDSFQRAVDAILHAKTIYVAGARSSASLSSFLAFNLNLIFDNVRNVQAYGGSEIFEQLIHIGEGDVILGISFPRYSKRIINAVQYAKSNQAQVIAITDSASSPLAPHADVLLTAKTDMVSYVDSLVAPLSIINALIVAISRSRQSELDSIFERLEKIWRDYDVYVKS